MQSQSSCRSGQSTRSSVLEVELHQERLARQRDKDEALQKIHELNQTLIAMTQQGHYLNEQARTNESAWELGLACGGEIAVYLEQVS